MIIWFGRKIVMVLESKNLLVISAVQIVVETYCLGLKLAYVKTFLIQCANASPCFIMVTQN